MWQAFTVFLADSAYKISPNGIAPTGTTTIGAGLSKIIVLLFQIIGSLSLVFVVVGGMMIVLSGGNPARLKQGREAVLYSCIGLIVAIGGFAIVSFVSGALK